MRAGARLKHYGAYGCAGRRSARNRGAHDAPLRSGGSAQIPHAHQFVISGRSYGQPDDFDKAVVDETAVTLAQAVGTRIMRFAYVYDFGDNWEGPRREGHCGQLWQRTAMVSCGQAAPAAGGLWWPRRLRGVPRRDWQSEPSGARIDARMRGRQF
jgi:hypothetical protein